MRVANREAFRIIPRWYGELNLGLSLILFGGITVYPWRGTTSAVALAVAVSVAITGALVLLHSVTLAKRARWRWVKTDDPSPDRVVFPKERMTATAISLLMLATVVASLDFSAPTLALRSGWWIATVVGLAFSFVLFVGWRARN